MGLPSEFRPRIISLIASATEMLCALGLESSLVGRSHECDYPPAVRSLPVCTRPRFDISGTSAEIDRRVRESQLSAAEDALGVYEVFPAKLRALQPTHIVTQTQCEVCAVSLDDVQRAVGQITGSEVTIISLQTTSLASFWHDLCRVASILGVTKNGVQLVAALQTRMRRIEAKTMPLKSRPTVVCLEWADPLMAAGYWMPELVRMAGGDALLAEPGKHSPPITSGDLRRAGPDVLVIAPCGFDLSRAREDLPVLASRPDWENLTAVRQGRVYLADGNQYFNRPGPRLADTLEILAEILHPELFDFGHQGTAWEPCHARPGSAEEDRAEEDRAG